MTLMVIMFMMTMRTSLLMSSDLTQARGKNRSSTMNKMSLPGQNKPLSTNITITIDTTINTNTNFGLVWQYGIFITLRLYGNHPTITAIIKQGKEEDVNDNDIDVNLAPKILSLSLSAITNYNEFLIISSFTLRHQL